jgi:hypothetical protein
MSGTQRMRRPSTRISTVAKTAVEHRSELPRPTKQLRRRRLGSIPLATDSYWPQQGCLSCRHLRGIVARGNRCPYRSKVIVAEL